VGNQRSAVRDHARRKDLSAFVRSAREVFRRVDPQDASIDMSAIPLYNRPYLVEEFEQVARAVGFTGFRWGRDASLSFDLADSAAPLKPLHELYYEGNLRVWECIVTKPGILPQVSESIVPSNN